MFNQTFLRSLLLLSVMLLLLWRAVRMLLSRLARAGEVEVRISRMLQLPHTH